MENKLEKQLEKQVQHEDKEIQKLIDPAELERIKQEAESMVNKFSDVNATNNLDSIIDVFASLGQKEQKAAGESIEFLKRPINSLASGDKNNLQKTLLELRNQVDEINPGFNKEGKLKAIINKILRKNPIENYIRKYQSVETQIDKIVEGLLRGRDRLQEDTVELEMIKAQAIERMNDLRKQIYFGKELFELLEKLEKEELAKGNQETVNAIRKSMKKVNVRRQNMMSSVAILQQSIAAVDVIKETNENLEESIFNSITTVKNVTTISAAIQLALNDQRNVINAVNKTNESMENMILSNAKLLKHNTEESTKMLEKSSISIEKLREAFNDVYSAIEMTEASTKRIIDNSKRYISELEKLSDEMDSKLN